MTNFKYSLEKYKGMKTRHLCPNCQNKQKTFSLYIDNTTKEYVNRKVGRCDRENNCGYHYTPGQYFNDNKIKISSGSYNKYNYSMPLKISEKPKPISFIKDEILMASLKAYGKNHFISFLNSKFGNETTTELIKRYFLGSSSHWEGATIFWQIDTQLKIRTGKIILYSPSTGKRVKEPIQHINWVHNVSETAGFNLRQVLFGEHLLLGNSMPCALVESEKSAIIASLYLPQYIWLATGGISNLNSDLCESLKGRKVVLFPDLKGYDKWKAKAAEIESLTNYSISDLLENKASESEKDLGLDIADYLLKYDLRELNQLDKGSGNPVTEPIEKAMIVEIPFAETQLYESFMLGLESKYFSNPLFLKLKNEKPFTEDWNKTYQKIRFRI